MFKGNITTCAIDDVPMKVSDYDKRIAEIIPDTLFKMLTNPEYFCSMKWQKQREILFEIAGPVSDDEIVDRKQEYRELMDMLSGKSLAEYKASIAATKAKAKKELQEIPTRIDEINSNKPTEQDWEQMEKNIRYLTEELNHTNEQIASTGTMSLEQQEMIDDKRRRISELEEKRSKLLHEAQKLATMEYHEANRKYLDSTKRRIDAKSVKENKQWVFSKAWDDREKTASRLAELKEIRVKLLKEYEDVASREYVENDRCPVCGQRLPQVQLDNAREKFESEIDKELERITAMGKQTKETIKELESRLSIETAAAENAKAEYEKAMAEEQDCIKAEEENKKPELRVVKPEDIPAYIEAKNEIGRLMQEIQGMKSQEAEELKKELTESKKSLEEKIIETKSILRDREKIAEMQKRAKELEEKGKSLAAAIADLEQKEYIIQSYSRDRIEEIEKKVNAKFAIVQFQLFDYTIDGNETECCIPLVGGVQYGSANKASQIYAGFEIARILSEHFDVQAPIFVDNAEALSELPEMPNQMIYLEVSRESRGSELTIKNNL